MPNDFSFDPSCKALWRFEPGALLADSIGSHTLTDHNTVQESLEDKWEGSGAARFSRANNEYFTIAHANLAAGFPFKNNDTAKTATFCCWYKATTLPSGGQWQHLFSKWSWPNDRSILLYLTDSNLVLAWATGAMVHDDWTICRLTASRVYHITLVLDGVNKAARVLLWDETAQDLKVYSKTNFSAPLYVNAVDFAIGNSYNDTCWLDGILDELVVFNTLKTDAAIIAIRQATYPDIPVVSANNFTNEPRCVAVWNFEPGALVADSKGNHTLIDNNTVGQSSLLNTYKQGEASALFNDAAVESLSIADANLASGFPLKSGDTIKKATFCFWFCPRVVPGFYNWDAIVSKWDWSGGKISLVIGMTDGNFRMSWAYGSGQSCEDWNGIYPVTAYRWYHVGVALNGPAKTATVRLYDETNAVANTYTRNFNNDLRIVDTALTLGGEWNGSYFNGYLDEVAVFNDVLSAAEIDAIRRGVFPLVTNRLQVTSLLGQVEWDMEPILKVASVAAQAEYYDSPLLKAFSLCAQVEYEPLIYHRVYPPRPTTRALQSQSGKRKFPVIK